MSVRSSDIKIQDFDDICRLCLEKSVFLKPLFSEDDGVEDDFASDDGNGNESATEMVKSCTGIEISPNDKLPNFMCSKCLEKLLQCNNFRRQCLKSEKVLKDAILRHENGLDEDYDAFDNIVVDENNKDVDLIELYIDGDELNEIRKRSLMLFATEPIKCDEIQPADDCNTNEDRTLESNSGEKGIVEPETSPLVVDFDKDKGVELIDHTEKPPESSQSEDNKPSVRTQTRKKVKMSKHRLKQCQVCGLMTKAVKIHMLTHTGGKNHKCPVCGKRFSQKGNLRRHSDIHLNDRKYRCSFCDKRFTNPKSLSYHIVSHAKEKRYVCNVCGKAFEYSHTLLQHKRSHLQDKQHECNACHKWFLTKYDMKKHSRIHTGLQL